MLLRLIAAFIAGYAVSYFVNSDRASQSAAAENTGNRVVENGSKLPAVATDVASPSVEQNQSAALDSVQKKEESSRLSAREISSEATDALISNPIILPDTHARFVQKRGPTMADIHAEIEREEVDHAWGQTAEQLLNAFLTSGETSQSVVVHSLQCRTTRCELAGTWFDAVDPGLK